MDTKFAPAERSSFEDIKKQQEELINIEYIQNIFDSFPFIIAILNENRQIILSNDSLLKTLNVDSIGCIEGLRPGEAINCIYSGKEEGGCGCAENCKYCGAVNTIINSMKSGKKEVGECRIQAYNTEKEEIALDLSVCSTPFKHNDKQYFIISLADISDEKRRKALEHIFFHDLLNIAGSIKGVVELMKTLPANNENNSEYINFLEKATSDLLAEISIQKELSAAESGRLKVNIRPLSAIHIVQDVYENLHHHEVSKNKEISIGNQNADVLFNSDKTLVKRILNNMLKNALEASKEGESVNICFSSNENNIIFSVHNKAFIPREVELQIFQRSFSTKGMGRGLGSYSMKLLAENYLKGKVSFKTSATEGTTFYFEIPIN